MKLFVASVVFVLIATVAHAGWFSNPDRADYMINEYNLPRRYRMTEVNVASHDMDPITVPVLVDAPIDIYVIKAVAAESRYRIIKAFFYRDNAYTHMLQFKEKMPFSHMLTSLEPNTALINGEIEVSDVVPMPNIEDALPTEMDMPDSNWFDAISDAYRLVVVVFDDRLVKYSTKIVPYVAIEIKDPPSQSPSEIFADESFMNEKDDEDDQFERAVLASLQTMFVGRDQEKTADVTVDKKEVPKSDRSPSREHTALFDEEDFSNETKLNMNALSMRAPIPQIIATEHSSLYFKFAIEGSADLHHYVEDRQQLPGMNTQCFGNDAVYVDAKKMVVASTSGPYQHAFCHAGVYAQILTETFTRTRSMHWSQENALQTAFQTMQMSMRASTTILSAELVGNVLRILSIGSCQAMILRRAEIIFLSPPQWLSASRPAQFTTGQRQISDDMIKQYDFEVTQNDIVIVGTDGLFDQLHTRRIEKIVGKSPENRVDIMAKRLMEAAFAVMHEDRESKTPYSERLAQYGVQHRGGKPDDAVVVVGMVMRRTSQK